MLHRQKLCLVFSDLRIRDCLVLFFKSLEERSVDQLWLEHLLRRLETYVQHMLWSQGIQTILFCRAVITWEICTFPTAFPFEVVP